MYISRPADKLTEKLHDWRLSITLADDKYAWDNTMSVNKDLSDDRHAHGVYSLWLPPGDDRAVVYS